jgi:hypothetical protein
MNPAASAGSAPAPPANIRETTEAKLPEKETDNSTRQLPVTAPSARVEDLPVNPTNTPGPPTLETFSIPAQIVREQIASGKVVEPPAAPPQAARGRGQRVVGAARDAVEERLGPRVEKLRQASNVVWGEAQDDPNLRFILIAVFLFIIASVIILLGTYLR